MAEQSPAEKPEDWRIVAQQIAAALADWLPQFQVAKTITAAHADAKGNLLGTVLNVLADVGVKLASSMGKAEDAAGPAFSKLAASAVSDLFGTTVSAAAFGNARDRAGRSRVAADIGEAVLRGIASTGGALAPGDAAAKRYLTMVIQLGLEGWLDGWMFELLTSLVPFAEIGSVERFADLDDTLAESLGLGRLSRRVLSPLIDVVAVTPYEWQINKTYRPKLLAAAEAVRQFHRGRWTREQLEEELARQGYSSDRIEALIAAQRHFFSPADVRAFVASEHWTREEGLQHLKEQGYTLDDAENALRLEGIKRINQLEDEEARAIVAAYVDRGINHATFAGLLRDAVGGDAERNLITEAAELRRTLNQRRVSLSQGEELVRRKVWNIRDYRKLLEDYGYVADDVLALELLLRAELAKEAELEDLRRQAQAERAAEQAATAEAAAARKRQVEQDRAIAARGSLADLERAFVRGLIPFGRVAEVLRVHYDDETVGIYQAALEEDRQKYLAQQAKADTVEKTAAARNIGTGDLKAAVLAGVLTVDELGRALTARGFSNADAGILVETMRARLADLAAARQKQADAAARAKVRAIDLGKFEQLVRRGLRTLAQYTALLEDLGFDAGAVAAMVDLLTAQIADDQAARTARAAGEARLRAKGLSLEQARRAVLLGLQPLDWFAAFLRAQDFALDAQGILLAELRADLEEAEAARARRTAAAPPLEARRLPLTTVRRAAQLGLIHPDTYAARLEADGYAPEDVDLDLELLLLEIADVQATRARRDQADAAGVARGLSLADVARAVKAGAASREDYRARAVALGYALEDADTLVRVLEEELAALADARARRDPVATEVAARNLSLGQLAEAVKKGFQSIDWYAGELAALGYAADDVELLAALLEDELTPAPGGTEAG